MEQKTPDRLTLAAFAATIVLGGNNAVAVRFSNSELPPLFGAAVRFAAASLLLFLLILILRLPIPRGRTLVGAIVFGVLAFGLSYALIYWSLLEVQAGYSMVVLAVVPLLTFFFALAHRQEAFRLRALLGTLLSLGGIAVVFSEGLSANLSVIPLLALILAAACFAEAIVLIKFFPQAHPITTNAVALAVGAGVLMGLSLLLNETPVVPKIPATWLALGYLVFFGSVGAFVLGLYVIKRWTASASSYQFVLFPIVTIPVGAWLSNEMVTFTFLIGGALILAGVYIGALAATARLKFEPSSAKGE